MSVNYQMGLLVIGLAGLCAGCRPGEGGRDVGTGPTDPPAAPALLGTWLLLPEARVGPDTLVYRRNTYRFPFRPAGRPGFRVGEGGRFTRYDVAPGGGLRARPGTWRSPGAGRLQVVLPDSSYELTVLSLRGGELRLRR